MEGHFVSPFLCIANTENLNIEKLEWSASLSTSINKNSFEEVSIKREYKVIGKTPIALRRLCVKKDVFITYSNILIVYTYWHKGTR